MSDAPLQTVGARTFTQMFRLQVAFGLWCVPAATVNALLHMEQSNVRLHWSYMGSIVL